MNHAPVLGRRERARDGFRAESVPDDPLARRVGGGTEVGVVWPTGGTAPQTSSVLILRSGFM